MKGKLIGVLLFVLLLTACTFSEKDQQDDTERFNEVSIENREPVPEFSVVTLTKIDQQSQFMLMKIPTSRTLIRDIEVSQVEKEIMATLGEFQAIVEEETTTLTLPDHILFDFDSFELVSNSKQVIEQLVQVVEASEGVVRIIGHTDSIGQADYNQQLSEKRAQAVVEALVEEEVDEARLQALGYGAEKPIAPNHRPDGSDDEKGRQKNRRVEVVVQGLFKKE